MYKIGDWIEAEVKSGPSNVEHPRVWRAVGEIVSMNTLADTKVELRIKLSEVSGDAPGICKVGRNYPIWPWEDKVDFYNLQLEND